MAGFVQRLRDRLEREKFLPSRLGIFIHPFYIIRRRLFTAVAAEAASIDGRLLDFGCGSQPYRALFPHISDYTGVDIEVSGHSHAKSKVDVFYNGRTLPFEDKSFDSVISFEVFEHVFNLSEMLPEIGRVMRPGGTILFTIPFAWPEHEQPYDFARYSSFGIRSLLDSSGFDVVSVVKTSNDVEAIVQLWAGYMHATFVDRSGPFRAPLQLLLVMPITLVGLVLGKLLPNPGTFYCNLIVRARRNGPQTVP